MSNERQVKKEQVKRPFIEGVICSNPGEHIAPVYKRVFDPKLNRKVVKKVDETDLFEFIQASKSVTDLAVLQKRFIELGEIPNVDPTLGSNDLTIMPGDIHSLYDMVNDLNASFNQLPESIKAIFGDGASYGKAVLDGSYAAKIKAGLKKKEPEKTPEKGEGDAK